MRGRSVYSPRMPGRLVPTTTLRGRNMGFIPDPLPESFPLPEPLRRLSVMAHKSVQALDALVAACAHPGAAVEFLRLRDAIRSCASDRAVPGTLALLAFGSGDKEALVAGKGAWKEALRYRQALVAGARMLAAGEGVPVRALIQEIHQRLFSHRPRKKAFAGRLRRGPIQMGEGIRYVPPPYRHVVPLLHGLERQLCRPSDIDPVARAFMVHYQFESIHPFTDGNGRVGRILLALTLNHWLQTAHPVVCVSPALCNHKAGYTGSMFRVNTHGDWTPWLSFGMNAVTAQARDAALRLKQVAAWQQRCGAGIPARKKAAAQLTLQGLVGSPFVNGRGAARWFAGDAAEAGAALETLCAAGVLRRIDTGLQAPHYLAPALLQMLLQPLQPAPTRRAGSASV